MGVRNSNDAGFTIAEITLVLGIMGVLTVVATPMFLRYYQGAQLTVAARQLASTLNQARQLAISQNGPVCVHNSSTAVHVHQGTCGAPGTTWLGAGTDGSGDIALPAGVTLTSTGNPQFTYLGAASPGATYTVRHTQTNTTLTVTIAGSGRITVP